MIPPAELRPQRIRRAVFLAALLAITVFALALLGSGLPHNDFVEYWAAARLFVHSADPYAPAALLPIQQSVGWSESRPLMFLSPPWTLPILAPVGLLPYRAAHGMWFAFCVATLVFSIHTLWRLYGGIPKRKWVAWAVAASFFPNVVCLLMCQTAPVLLASAAGFLVCMRKQRYVLAGACLVGVSLKPHLLYLVAVAVVFVVLRDRNWRIAAGAAVAWVGLTTVTTLVDPQAFASCVRNVPAESMHWMFALGGLLRRAFGAERHWLQFVPSVVGLVWFLFRWRSKQGEWEWLETVPVLASVSVVTASYGGYYDQAVLMLAGIPAAAAVARHCSRGRVLFTLAVFAAFSIVQMLLLFSAYAHTQELLIVTAPVWASLFLGVRFTATFQLRSRTMLATAPVPAPQQ